MKLSVFYDHILQAESQSGKTLEELLSGVKAAGIEAVEIRMEYLLEHEETLELLKRAGLGLSCIYEFYDMDSKDEIEKIHKHIKTASRVHAGKILIVPGFLSKEEAEELWELSRSYEKLDDYFNHNTKVQLMAKGLCDCVRIGQEAGITVTVEDFDDIKSPLSCMNGILWFMENVPGLRYALDMGNFIYHGEDVLEAWELLKDKVSHVHCKDRGENFSSVAAGEGSIPIALLVEKLKAAGYDDYLAIEHFDAPQQESCMKKSAEFLLNLISD